MAEAAVRAVALACPNCGGQVELRGFANTLTATCPSCFTVLDTSTPAVSILRTFGKKQRYTPVIPLGSRGDFDGVKYEVIGFQIRTVKEDDEVWHWSEYLLFNPYNGFRYLTEYNGHWNFVTPVRGLPARVTSRHRPAYKWQGRTYRHFSTSIAKTEFVLGEFPWRVVVDETVRAEDYVTPPYILSAERTQDETTWSHGEYLDGRQIWRAFKLKGSPPRVQGIFLNQPSPYTGTAGGIIKVAAILEVALVALLIFFIFFSGNRTVLRESHQFQQGTRGETSFVTPVFDLTGRLSNVEVQTRTDLDNHWMFVGYALIDTDTGQGYDFGREVSYYHGRDSDGDWSEGGKVDKAIVPSVPSGRYYLRVEPEAEPSSPSINYEIVVQRDVPNFIWFMIAALLIPLPAIALAWRGFRFEYERWQQSDYGSVGTSSGDD